jgi:predicted DCC family thiol-disulfide oxidoreductase YuxK
MFCLEVIKSESFQSPPKIITPWERECSFCQSSVGFVIHSAAQRSTAFISKTDHAECWEAASFWLKASPAARDAFIEGIMMDLTVADAAAAAFRAARPGWRLQLQGEQGGAVTFRVIRQSGKLRETVASLSLPDLFTRTA